MRCETSDTPQANTIAGAVVDQITRNNVIRAIAVTLLAITTPAICSATDISLVGSWSYNQSGTTVVLTVDKIQNNSLITTSGSLKMELWAFHTPFTGSQSGYQLAIYTLPQVLQPGYAYVNVSSGSIPFTPPPEGLWYYCLLITEYNGSNFVYDTYSNASQLVVCDKSGTCGSGNMTYHGGAVQHNQKVYTIFWSGPGNSFPSGYQAIINQFVQDLNGSSYYAIANQYGDSSGNISPFVNYGGTWSDTTNPTPSSLPTDQAVLNQTLIQEVLRATAANSWTIGEDTVFFVYTPSNLTNSAPYCGFHSSVTYPSGNHLAFGFIPFPASNPNGTPCLSYSAPWPNGQIIDDAISVTAHEIVEAATDPFDSGWYLIGVNGEIGDLCAYKPGPRDSTGADLQLNGHEYLVQMLWSNAVSGCAMAGTVVAAPALSLSSNILTFVSQPIGTLSAVQNVTISNTGRAFLTVASIAITGNNSTDFIATNSCGSSIAVGGSCTISVSFKPAAAGLRTASLAINDNAVGSPHAINLTGTGIAVPVVSLSSNSLNFGTQSVGSSSTTQKVVVTNMGTGPLTIGAIAFTGNNPSDFPETNDCGSTVLAGAFCTITVMFKPALPGSRASSLVINDNAAGSPHSVTLTGTAIVVSGNTYHVFPQVADGYNSDGSYYQSTLVVTNSNPATGNPTCTLQFHGLAIGGQSQASFTVGSVFVSQTPGNIQALQTGYASLQCSSNVEAQLLYALYTHDGIKISEATVFSSPSATWLRIFADERGGAQLGLALANDSTQNGNYTIRIYDNNGNLIGAPALTVNPGSSRAFFLDQLTTIPNNNWGPVDITANSGTASVIGLKFTGTLFTTIPATKMQ
jgi:hypothetical protein